MINFNYNKFAITKDLTELLLPVSATTKNSIFKRENEIQKQDVLQINDG